MSFLDYAAARQKRNSFPMQQLSSQNWYEVEKSVENWFLSKNWTNIILNKIYSIFLSSRNNWGRWSTYQSPRSLSRLISSLWTAGTPSSTKSKQVSSKQNLFMVNFWNHFQTIFEMNLKVSEITKNAIFSHFAYCSRAQWAIILDIYIAPQGSK